MRHLNVLPVLGALLIPATLMADIEGVKAEDWVDGKLRIISNESQTPEVRIAARDAIVKMLGPDRAANLSSEDLAATCRHLAQQLGALIKNKDQVTALNAIIVAARVEHLYLVPVLSDALDNSQAMVRYWAARGLGMAQSTMSKIGGQRFWTGPLAKLAARAQAETSPLVLDEIYLALGLRAKMPSIKEQMELFTQFMAAYNGRIALLDKRKLDTVDAELAGVKLAGEWATQWSKTRGATDQVAQVLKATSQLLKYAVQLLAAGELEDAAQETLVKIVPASAESLGAISGKVTEAGKVAEEMKNNDMIPLELAVNDLVGAAGMENWALKSAGVDPPPKPLTPKE